MTVILGIDPGSRITGYGLVKDTGSTLVYLDSGCIRTTDGQLSQRLLEIFDGICELMETYKPNEVAIENVFFHQNPSTALKLGHARGAAMVACASHRILVSEYSPREIKQSVVGYGAAEKDQVKAMIMRVLMLSTPPNTDSSDALAAAVCHSYVRKNLMLKRKVLGSN